MSNVFGENNTVFTWVTVSDRSALRTLPTLCDEILHKLAALAGVAPVGLGGIA